MEFELKVDALPRFDKTTIGLDNVVLAACEFKLGKLGSTLK